MLWLIIALACGLLAELVDVYVSIRQLKRYKTDKQPPKEVEDVVSLRDFLTSCRYNAEKMTFKLLQDGIGTLLSSIIMLSFLYPQIWKVAESVASTEFGQSLVFLGINMSWEILYQLPWDLYGDFYIEEKYGFNKKTLKLFFLDLFKTTAIAIAMGLPITYVTIKAVRWAGPDCWYWLWAFFVAVTLVMIQIAPILIMPLFNKYEPLQDSELRRKVEELAARIHYPLGKIYQMDGSKRSSHSNAFLYGFWRNKRIVLFDTLLKHSHEEIVSILAHELGHWKMWHSFTMIGLMLAQIGLYLKIFSLTLYQRQPFIDFGFQDCEAVVVGIFIFSKLIVPLNEILGKIMICVSRRNEFEADHYAAKLGYAKDLQKALLRLGVENKMPLNVDSWYAWLNYTHPTLVERVKVLKGTKQE